jgi:hypothetical protein
MAVGIGRFYFASVGSTRSGAGAAPIPPLAAAFTLRLRAIHQMARPSSAKGARMGERRDRHGDEHEDEDAEDEEPEPVEHQHDERQRRRHRHEADQHAGHCDQHLGGAGHGLVADLHRDQSESRADEESHPRHRGHAHEEEKRVVERDAPTALHLGQHLPGARPEAARCG